MSSNVVTLHTGGQIHEGWTDVSITLGLDRLSGDFDVRLTDEWVSGGSRVRLGVAEGAPCVVRIDGETVVTGYVDDVTTDYDATRRETSITGRDKAGDLVDCSAPVKDWQGRSLSAIAADLCAPFGISVQARAGAASTAFPRFSTNPGDTVAATLERLLRQRGLMAWSDGLGGLVIGTVSEGSPVATIMPGDTVLTGRGVRSMADRFSDYSAVAHADGGANPDDDDDAETITSPSGSSTDPGVTRHRPLVLVAETQSGGPSLASRAAHEAKTRAARGRQAVYTLPGWRNAQGGLWRPGQTVELRDELVELSGLWVVTQAQFRQSSREGTVTELTVMRAAAFAVLAEPEKPKKKRGWDAGDDD
ncbi:phage baseplate assembly protein [Nitratidesulfovibrio liaohensis]|uniref:phage baseplate assembly protein n=1 Tax=Nitratidesulfovibrio liaohensis TaxID=2604158 RepID=UPI0014244E41|nr:contractile injection system protein, VgrG/Pvc8 family [Nitratidesulfovibrio liaohensis]NHZ45514.1 hypothetical protein [Nitratidesulfovibrio liaohensis]